MTNNRITYTLPKVIDPIDRICVQLEIPNETFHRSAFLGAIHSLTRWYNWDRDEDKTGKQVGDVWLEIYNKLEDELGEQSCREVTTMALRTNPDDTCEIQYVNENGTWETFFDFGACNLFNRDLEIQGILDFSQTIIVNGDYVAEKNVYDGNPATYDPQVSINAQNAINRNKLLCYALRILIHTSLETIARNKEEAERNAITLSMIIGAGLALAFAPLTPLVVGGILAGFSAGAILGVQSVSETELRDEIARDDVLCHVYNALDNDNMGRATFSAVFNTIPFDTDTPQYKQALALKNLFLDTGSYLAVINLMKLNLPYVDALSNECDICGGGGVWEQVFDFTSSSHSGFWTNVTSIGAPFSLPELTAYVAGEGWGNGRLYDNNRQREQAYLIGVWDSRNITDINIEYKLVVGVSGSFQFNNITIEKRVGATFTNVRTVTPAGTIAGTFTTNQNIGNVVMDGCKLQVTGYQRAFNNNPQGATFIRKVTIKGTGDNPFI